MEQAIKWTAPARSGDSVVRVSKCGHYRIEKRMMANIGGRAGCFSQVSYLVTGPGERQVADTLADAKAWAELFNNPDWEP